jgi:hypothetical protein
LLYFVLVEQENYEPVFMIVLNDITKVPDILAR